MVKKIENVKGVSYMVKKKDLKVALMQRYKEKGLLPLVDDYALLREVFHSGNTHVRLDQRGVIHGKEK